MLVQLSIFSVVIVLRSIVLGILLLCSEPPTCANDSPVIYSVAGVEVS